MRTLLGRFFVLFLCVQSVFLGGCNSREKPTAETAKINLPRRTSRTLFEERLLGLVRESELLARDVSSKKAAPLEARMRLNELEKAWTEFAAEHPDNIEAQILYGKFLRSARFDEAAYKVFLKVDKKNPNFAVVKQQLSTYEAEQKDFKSSYLHIKEAVSLEPGSAVYLAQLGELLFKAGAYLVKSGEISKESRDVEMQDAFKRASELESESFDTPSLFTMYLPPTGKRRFLFGRGLKLLRRSVLKKTRRGCMWQKFQSRLAIWMGQNPSCGK